MTSDKKENVASMQAVQPGIQIIAQYVKDFSFENPNAPESLVTGWPAPETNVQVFLGQNKMKDDIYESIIHIRVEARKKDDQRVCFIADLHYAALVALKNIPAENHAPVLMVEVPKLLFPFAREALAHATSSGGYPPLYIAPISFENLFVAEMQRRQGEPKTKAQ